MEAIVGRLLISVVAKNLTERIRQYHLGLVVDKLPERFRFKSIDFTEDDVYRALLDMALEASVKRLSKSASDAVLHDMANTTYEEPDPKYTDPITTYSAFNAFLKVCNEGDMYNRRDYKWMSRLKRELACFIVSDMPECIDTPWGHIPHKEVGVDDYAATKED